MTTRKVLIVLSVILVCCNFNAGNVHAAWSSDPSVNNVICPAVNDQKAPAVISDGSGGAIITWMDRRSGSSNNDIYAQRINASGVVQWEADGVAICTAANDNQAPNIISDGNGGAIITWSDERNGSSNNDIYAQRINASGVVQWTANGVAICTAANDQYATAIISDGSGGAIIAWYDYRSGVDKSDIYAQRINASGEVQWTANGVSVCTAGGAQETPAITRDGFNGAILSWRDRRSGNSDIYAQRVNASGVVQWTVNGVAICTAANDQYYPTIISDGFSGAIVTWIDYRSGATSDIYAQRINVNGVVQWTPNGVAICTAEESQLSPQITSDGSGGAIIAWEDKLSRSGDHKSDIYAQRINASGVVQWTANGVAICAAANEQAFLAIISDGSGGAIITWEDFRTGSYPDIYAQRINASGVVQWAANGVAICTEAHPQNYPALISDGSGGGIITWEDYRSGYNNSDIYAQRVYANGALTTVVVAPVPDVKANGQDGYMTVPSGTYVSITASLAPGTETEKIADWWIVASTPAGIYSLNISGWTPGINLLLQYPLVSVPLVEIFGGSLPAGDYIFVFGMDTSPNGSLDTPIYYDYVQVHIGN